MHSTVRSRTPPAPRSVTSGYTKKSLSNLTFITTSEPSFETQQTPRLPSPKNQDSKPEDLTQAVNKILESRPEWSGDHKQWAANLKRHDQTKAATVDLFAANAPKDSEIFDGKSYIDKWESGGTVYEGMRHSDTKNPHGICRVIEENAYIWEAQFKDGVKHGLTLVWANRGLFQCELRNEEVQKAYFCSTLKGKLHHTGLYSDLKKIHDELYK